MIVFNTTKEAVEDFSRYEFKFILDPNLRKRVEEDIKPFVRYDGFASEKLKNKYFVRSLYFDNDVFSHYYEKIDGVRSRRKFRLRTYQTDQKENSPIFLELKGRHLDRTYKRRVKLAQQNLNDIQGTKNLEKLLDHHPGNEVFETFFLDTNLRRIKPKICIDYLRRPYVSEFDVYFRLTFDEMLVGTPSQNLFFEKKAASSLCLPGLTILEIKFHRRIPAWFHRIIQTHNLTRTSVSKFCIGIETCRLAENLE